jgi:hypothetical protein
MRSWGNRPDTAVCDEPFYAHYLLRTGAPHPGAGEVIAHHEADWRQVLAFLTGPVPGGKSIFFQKHMAHHLLPHMGEEWFPRLTHCFLIRDPRAMLLSLVKILPDAKLEDTGLPQQVAIFEDVRRRSGVTPPVVDARDLLEDPRRILGELCGRLGVPFSEAMLSWPAGPRPTDGVWARHWYANVERSTGFEPFVERREALSARLEPVHDRSRELYELLHAHRLR